MRAAAILIFDKCLYLQGRLRLTTARRLSAYSAYMSSRALASTTASSLFSLKDLHGNCSRHAFNACHSSTLQIYGIFAPLRPISTLPLSKKYARNVV